DVDRFRELMLPSPCAIWADTDHLATCIDALVWRPRADKSDVRRTQDRVLRRECHDDGGHDQRRRVWHKADLTVLDIELPDVCQIIGIEHSQALGGAKLLPPWQLIPVRKDDEICIRREVLE